MKTGLEFRYHIEGNRAAFPAVAKKLDLDEKEFKQLLNRKNISEEDFSRLLTQADLFPITNDYVVSPRIIGELELRHTRQTTELRQRRDFFEHQLHEARHEAYTLYKRINEYEDRLRQALEMYSTQQDNELPPVLSAWQKISRLLRR